MNNKQGKDICNNYGKKLIEAKEKNIDPDHFKVLRPEEIR